MLQTCTHTILHRPNETVHFVIQVVRKVVGAKVQTIVKSLAKPTAHRSALREDALDQSQGNVVIW